MSNHNGVVFNHSCLKVPRNPMSKLPAPNYEQKLLNELENEARKLSLGSDSDVISTKGNNKQTGRNSIRSLIDFYDSIPDYGDVNHLSNREFYQRLEFLKAKQKSIYDYLEAEIKVEDKNTTWVDDYKNFGSRSKDEINRARMRNSKSRCNTLKQKNSSHNISTPDQDSIPSSGKATPLQPPSRRSVRIESPRFDSDKFSTPPQNETPDLELYRPKSRTHISSADSKGFDKSLCSYIDSAWEEEFCGMDGKFDLDRGYSVGTTRSLPGSPLKSVGWKDSGITIPKPFQMTVRDEEDRIVDEIIEESKKPPKSPKRKMFRANDIPIESQIPLFWQIMEDQERRREIVKAKSKAALAAQMKPFSFTKRDEEIQILTRRLSKSTPTLCLYQPPRKPKKFKAKPVPKNLFSNYIYQKMYEDEFYRALKKKIRAEEMLKAASLPPSMEKREKRRPKYIVCPRSYRECDFESNYISKDRKHYKIPNYKAAHERIQLELEELKNDFITTSPRPFKLKTAKRSEKRAQRSQRSSSAGNSSNSRTNSSLEARCINRSNLAAVLRIQSAKKKQEFDMLKRIEESRIREESRWREKIIRKKPAWQDLAYSHEEDLAMRLQLRREEERLRSEEHRQRMELMLGRVNQIPTLFERQTKINAQPKTKQELMKQLYEEFGSVSSSDKYASNYTNNGREDDEDNDDVEEEDEIVEKHNGESKEMEHVSKIYELEENEDDNETSFKKSSSLSNDDKNSKDSED